MNSKELAAAALAEARRQVEEQFETRETGKYRVEPRPRGGDAIEKLLNKLSDKGYSYKGSTGTNGTWLVFERTRP